MTLRACLVKQADVVDQFSGYVKLTHSHIMETMYYRESLGNIRLNSLILQELKRIKMLLIVQYLGRRFLQHFRYLRVCTKIEGSTSKTSTLNICNFKTF